MICDEMFMLLSIAEHMTVGLAFNAKSIYSVSTLF